MRVKLTNVHKIFTVGEYISEDDESYIRLEIAQWTYLLW